MHEPNDMSFLETSQDVLILQMVAAGIQRLSNDLALPGVPRAERAVSSPYPAPLQRAMNLLGMLCYERGFAPIRGLPELLEWARRPLSEWPFLRMSSTEIVGPRDALLGGPEGDMPTWICSEWAQLHADADVEANARERVFMGKVFGQCPDADSYTAFRRLLVEHPVLSEADLSDALGQVALQPLKDRLREAYIRIGRGYAVDGEFLTCSACGNLLIRDARGRLHCEDEACEAGASPEIGRQIRGPACWLSRELRQFIAAPGRAEIDLERRLKRLHVQVDLWPQRDAYDLKVTLPSGAVWAVDVKDWASPYALAQHADAIPQNPPWRHAFFVFPDARRKNRANYRDIFVEFASPRGVVSVWHRGMPLREGNTVAVYSSELVALVRAQIGGGASTHA